MRPTGLLIAVAVLVVLGGAIWFSNKKEAAKAGKSPTDTTTQLFTIPDDQFQEIRIKKLTDEVQDLKRNNGKWQLVEPKQLAADQDAVGSMVSTLTNLTPRTTHD